MTFTAKIGEIRSYGHAILQTIAVAAKHDTMDTWVILAKDATGYNYHEVWEMSPNATNDRIRVEAHTATEMMSGAEQALQDWADRAFGVNLF